VATLLVAGATTAGGQTRAASDVEAMIVRGERLVTANRLDEAASIANEALARRPESARAHYLLGVVHERRQQLDAAAAEYRAAIARAPKLAEAHDRLGFVLGTQGRSDEAIAEFERAIAIRPAFFDAQYHLGATLWWTKQVDRARVALGRAVRLRPAHAEARYYLAVAERQSGDLAAAIRDLRVALRYAPGLAIAQTAPSASSGARSTSIRPCRTRATVLASRSWSGATPTKPSRRCAR
ncbi:MAG: hypothetical protein DMG01_29645, partial [Acidobacteria bacterium]